MQRLVYLASLFVFAPLVAGCAGGGSIVPAASSVSPVSAEATTHDAAAPQALIASAQRSASSSGPDDAVAIDTGGPATGTYLADGDFAATNSWKSAVTNAIDTSAVSNPGPASIYQSNRVSPSIVYTIGGLTAKKAYVVRLSFVESYWKAAGKRVFNVAVNGTAFLTNFDIFAKAGAANKAITETTPSETSNAAGAITVKFAAVKDNAEIAAIEIQNIQPAGVPSPSPSPSSSPSPSPSPAPTASGTSDAPAMDASTLCVHFSSSPFCKPLPSNPAVSSSSAQWAALEFQSGRDFFGGPIQSNTANPGADSHDTSEPVEYVYPGIKTTSQTIECSKASYGPSSCEKSGLQGLVLDVPSNMQPEGNQDHHFSFDSSTAGGEFDFWLSDPLGKAGAKLNVGTAGFCKWGGDGTGCSNATATKILTSIGDLDPVLIKSEENSTTSTMPYALSSTALCASATWVYPAVYSDGFDTDATPACAGNTGTGRRPPEGTRWYLNVTDEQIDALNVPLYAKVILRTADKQHYGGIIVNTQYPGAPGLSMNFHRGDYTFMASEAGVKYAANESIPIATTGLNLAKSVVFCTNGTC